MTGGWKDKNDKKQDIVERREKRITNGLLKNEGRHDETDV